MFRKMTARLLPLGNGISTNNYLISRSIKPLSEIYQAAQGYLVAVGTHSFNILLTC